MARIVRGKSVEIPYLYSEISSFVQRSKVYGRGKSFAASVPSDNSKVQKARKRVPKDERRAMVQSFVNKYREINAGKFPTATDAMKRVGGGYYQIKKMLQEIEYKSKICSMNTKTENVYGTEVAKVNEASTNVEEVSISHLTKDAGSREDAQTVAGADIGDPGLNNAGADEGPESVIIFEKTLSEEASKPKTRDGPFSLNGKRKHISSDGADVIFLQNPEMPVQDPKPEQNQPSPDLHKFAMDSSDQQTDKEDVPKKKSVWGNIKSLADGFINLWKKL